MNLKPPLSCPVDQQPRTSRLPVFVRKQWNLRWCHREPKALNQPHNPMWTSDSKSGRREVSLKTWTFIQINQLKKTTLTAKSWEIFFFLHKIGLKAGRTRWSRSLKINTVTWLLLVRSERISVHTEQRTNSTQAQYNEAMSLLGRLRGKWVKGYLQGQGWFKGNCVASKST